MKEYRDEIYTLLHDAYFGDGMFYDGSALMRHARESNANYRRRKRLAYYLNYVAPIVDCSVAPVFKDEIRREYRPTKKLTMFFDNVDRIGTTLQNFIRRQATNAKLYGVVYIVVDNAAALGITDKENLDTRALPFLKAVLPKDVEAWHFDETGRLKDFTYKSTVYDNDKWHTRKYEWTMTTWRVIDADGKVLREGKHNLNKVPIVQWFGRDTDPTRVLPVPEFLAIAQTNLHIYHLCSLLTQICDNQTFNILIMQSADKMQDMTIGVNNLLTYPIDAKNPPGFIAPDSGPAKILMEQIDRLVGEMYRMSGINSVIGVESAKSGVARQWEFERTNQRLVDFALQCEKAEKDIISLYERWAGETVDYNCEYPRDFKISDVTESLTQAQQAIDLQLQSETFNVEVAKKLLASYMPNLEPDVYDVIIEELEAANDDIQKAKAFEPDDEGNIDEDDNSGYPRAD